jgi:hypothetical protein
MSLLCAFLLSHLLAVAITLWLTRIWEIGYITAFGLGLGVWLWPRPIACLVVSTVVYVIAYEGLRRGLEQFPWIPRKGVGLHTDLMARGPHEEPCGWPYDRLMREILNDRGFAQIDVILCCMLGAWWLFVLSSFIPDPQNRIASLLFPLIALTAVMAFGRLIIYIEGYQSPITPWARIRTFRWIIPGYDKIFVAPVCTILAGPISVGLLQMYRVPLGVCLPAATGIMVLVALITPPRLRRWRLTGQHRMVSPASRPNTAFVKVG